MSVHKKQLEKEFFDQIPKARKINPVFRKIFEFMYQAHLASNKGGRLLNIYSSKDFSGNREEVYKDTFFTKCEYVGVDFWQDTFFPEGMQAIDVQQRHSLPFPDSHFKTIVTTKIIMEHISEPEAVVQDLYRVLEKDGEVFIIAPLVRRQHQAPFDYFRYTEYGLRYLFEKTGFEIISIDHTNGFMATATAHAYFFQRGLNAPKFVKKILDFLCTWVIEPVGYFLDSFDNGYGRDFTQYFLVRAKK